MVDINKHTEQDSADVMSDAIKMFFNRSDGGWLCAWYLEDEIKKHPQMIALLQNDVVKDVFGRLMNRWNEISSKFSVKLISFCMFIEREHPNDSWWMTLLEYLADHDDVENIAKKIRYKAWKNYVNETFAYEVVGKKYPKLYGFKKKITGKMMWFLSSKPMY